MKIFFIISCIILNLNAINSQEKLLLNTYISEDSIQYINLKSYNLNKKLFSDIMVKIIINKKTLGNETKYLKFICDTKNIINANIKYQTNFDNLIFKLDKNSPEEIIIKFKFEKPKLLKISFDTLSQFDYDYILEKESLLYGMAYGIILCAFLYNFAIFFYNFEKSFLYYALMQIFLLVILYYNVILEAQTFISPMQQIITDFFETACILAMLLFTQEILNTKKSMKYINKIFNFLVYISIVDFVTIFIFKYSLLYNYIPRYWIVSICVITGLIAIYENQKVASFYFFGWSIVLVSLLITELNIFDIQDLYVMHIGLPLESLVLSFALAYKLKLSMDEKKQKEKMLIQQTKLASMGEMLNNIAHQWIQPLNNLSFININLRMAIKNNDINSLYLDDIAKDSIDQINFMSETLDNFKGFYQPNKKKEFFNISEVIDGAINIIGQSIHNEKIKLNIKIIQDEKINSYRNEFIQVLLNIINNAKDALLDKSINQPEIQIVLNKLQTKENIIMISDNAKGIHKDIVHKIFDPYFSTKNNNSGIGLYMSKIIVESHLKGEIILKNNTEGCCFIIKI